MSIPKEQLNADRQKVFLWRWSIAALVLCGVVAGVRASMTGKADVAIPGAHDGGAALEAKGGDDNDRLTDKSSKASTFFGVSIRKPAGPPRVATGLTDPHGNQVMVACSTCHTVRKPDFTNKVPADLKEFHGELGFSHGKVSCLSCHNSDDYDALKLADGARVEFTNVMTLCAQCHGQQKRDYMHGVHGGLNGFWDLSRGPQTKNNCVDCHHPHAPQFPKMQPTFKPKDRFLD